MSWNDYITRMKATVVDGNPVISEAAICGFEDETVWSASGHLQHITKEEIKRLNGDINALYVSGPSIGGEKCRMLRKWDEDKVNFLDLKTVPDSDGKTFNICVAKTGKTLVIGRGVPDMPGGQVDSTVCKTAKHLYASNF